ncbi:MAG TPA: hypothetical protein VFP84_16455 [Kofleriaceae bacterium]|nr:hypothetical protein [Kofleriaceae bacterium]
MFAATAATACGDNGTNNNGPGDAGNPRPIDAGAPTDAAPPIDGPATPPVDAGLCANVVCDDNDPCNGQETCNPDDGTCVGGIPTLGDGDSCGVDHVCIAAECELSKCGNSLVEVGEECDGGPGCTADCHFVCSTDPATQCAGAGLTPGECQTIGCGFDHTCQVVADTAKSGQACTSNGGTVCNAGACAAPGCGDGKLEGAEECDDGDVKNLDGCDSACKLEQVARINILTQQFVPDAFCTQNALGSAIIGDDGQTTIQNTWVGPVADGSLSIVFKFLGLSAPLGPDTNATFQLGFVNALPAPSPNPDVTYNGNADLDWWYVLDPNRPLANAAGQPATELDGTLSAGHLSAGPGDITLRILFAFQPAIVNLFHSRVDATIAPTVSAPTQTTMDPPGHLPSEHLKPAVTTIETSTDGEMCADVSVKSLSDTPMPRLLRTVCSPDRNGQRKTFGRDNTLLDAFVNGCAVFGTPAIQTTQPDGSLDGATYHFEVDPTTHKVTNCTKDGAPAALADCAANATYSSAFKFQSDRVILHRN